MEAFEFYIFMLRRYRKASIFFEVPSQLPGFVETFGFCLFHHLIEQW